MTDANAVPNEMVALLRAAIRYVDSYASNPNNHPQARDVARDLEGQIKAALTAAFSIRDGYVLVPKDALEKIASSIQEEFRYQGGANYARRIRAMLSGGET